MAAIHTYVAFKDAPRIDDLCPTCFNPSLKEYVLERIDLTGITPLATRIACTDCKTWTSEIKEITA